MPYKYVYMEPEIAWHCKDFNIYRTYDNNNYDKPYTFWFTLDEETCGVEGAYEFDIRDFEIYDEYLSIEENFDILYTKGYITKGGYRYKLKDDFLRHLL